MVGRLRLGSATERYFEADGYLLLRCLAQGLAMELHHLWYRRIRDDLIAKVKITDYDLMLLRHEQQGDSSKVIASALNTLLRTVDYRFQRLTSRLGQPSQSRSPAPA